jgi:hypothetical protein
VTVDVAEREAFQELLDSLSPQTFGMVAEADMGRQAREFLSSDIGRYLLGCAQQEHQEAVEKLKRVAFWRVRKVRELQNQAWRAESFMLWMRDLLIRGRAAEGALVEREE